MTSVERKALGDRLAKDWPRERMAILDDLQKMGSRTRVLNDVIALAESKPKTQEVVAFLKRLNPGIVTSAEKPADEVAEQFISKIVENIEERRKFGINTAFLDEVNDALLSIGHRPFKGPAGGGTGRAYGKYFNDEFPQLSGLFRALDEYNDAGIRKPTVLSAAAQGLRDGLSQATDLDYIHSFVLEQAKSAMGEVGPEAKGLAAYVEDMSAAAILANKLKQAIEAFNKDGVNAAMAFLSGKQQPASLRTDAPSQPTTSQSSCVQAAVAEPASMQGDTISMPSGEMIKRLDNLYDKVEATAWAIKDKTDAESIRKASAASIALAIEVDMILPTLDQDGRKEAFARLKKSHELFSKLASEGRVNSVSYVSVRDEMPELAERYALAASTGASAVASKALLQSALEAIKERVSKSPARDAPNPVLETFLSDGEQIEVLVSEIQELAARIRLFRKCSSIRTEQADVQAAVLS